MALREQLLAVADELRRRKTAGEKTVPISDETLGALRELVARQTAPVPTAARADQAPGEQAVQRDVAPAPEMRPAAVPGDRGPVAERAEPPPPHDQASGKASTMFTDTPTARPALKVSTQEGGAKIPPPPTVTLPEGDKTTRWEWLREHVVNHPVCRSHVRPGKKVVLGVGSLDAKIFFCGEAPGAEEEVQGEPFVGAAGELLTKMIRAMGLDRGQVYIGNIMNWRPEMPTPPGVEQIGNRPPTAQEMSFCLPFLQAQLAIVQPEVIVALGATATAGLLGAGSFKTLGEVRGRWHSFGGRPVMVTYHPSYLLRNNTNRAKRTVWEDLLQVMERAQLPVSDKQRNFFL